MVFRAPCGESTHSVRIAEKIGTRRPFFSFEFFPPRDDAAERNLLETIRALKPLDPGFVSITYGAGGSTRARTVEVAKRLRADDGFDVMAHVTCGGATVDELRALLNDLRRCDIENIMALRGDPPRGTAAFVAADGGLQHASDLIALLKAEFPFCVGGACYPGEASRGAEPRRRPRRAVDEGARRARSSW